jgi:4'-phosphopantetheinyl transferase
MPLIIHENITADCILGVWKIEESAEDLFKQVILTGAENDYYLTLVNESRKKQWLGCRAIIQNLLGNAGNEIVYDSNGKPSLRNDSHFLSLSHSGDYSVVILSKKRPVGIDIEKIRDRVERVKDRFLSPEELDQLGPVSPVEKLVVYWGAKEALYKIYGNPGLLCMLDITVKPFDYLCSGNGSTAASINTTARTGEYSIFYRTIDDYIIVYVY